LRAAADAAIKTVTAQADAAKAEAAANVNAEQQIADAQTRAATNAANAHNDFVAAMAAAAIEMVKAAAADTRKHAEAVADTICALKTLQADARESGVIGSVTSLYKADEARINAARDASIAATKALAERIAESAANAGPRERGAAEAARDEAVNAVIRQCHARIHEAEEAQAAQSGS